MTHSNAIHTAAGKIGESPSAQAWFASGERVGYDPKSRAIVRAHGAALNLFLRREGDLAQAVSFLPGFPDGSFGWAKVLPHLPDAAEMSKLAACRCRKLVRLRADDVQLGNQQWSPRVR